MMKPLGAQISHMLKDRGVDVIFGIPGVHNQEMYRGIEEAGITHVLARHEQGAGFMADGYARATGKPGVAYVITGPGVCNIMTPMGQAYSDSVPMLVISSCLDETAATKGQLHQMKDQETAAGCVCDWSETARTAEAAYQLIDRAFKDFTQREKRNLPVHIQVPIQTLTAPGVAFPKKTWQCDASYNSTSFGVSRMLANAKRPIFVFGGGVVTNAHIENSDPSSRQETVAQMAETAADMFGAAVFTTYAARGVVRTNYSCLFGSTLARPDSADVLAKADLVVAVGTTLSEVDLWRDQLGHECTLVRVDLDTTVLADHQQNQMTIRQDAGAFLSSLLAENEDWHEKDWTHEEVATFRAKARAETDAERPGIVPICDALRDAVPSDTMIYSDMTQMAYVAKEVWDMDRPGHWHHPYGFGTLGYALPAAIGGVVARRVGETHAPQHLPTMAIVGDYGFHYTMQELGVAVELGLPIPIILWDNGKLKEIEDSMVRGQIAPNAVIARNPDFCKLAEAFGAYSAEPQSLPEMQKAVQEAFQADGPTLIRITPEIVG